MLFFAKYANAIVNFAGKLFDKRENFVTEEKFVAQENIFDDDEDEDLIEEDEDADALEEDDGRPPEIKYKVPLPIINHEKLSNDSATISDLQEKLKELLQLNEETLVINNTIIKNKK
jgi:IMP dehydrogenase/GMP reductase